MLTTKLPLSYVLPQFELCNVQQPSTWTERWTVNITPLQALTSLCHYYCYYIRSAVT